MKLEDIINIYNNVTQGALVVTRKQTNPSTFAKGLKKQTIEVLNFRSSSTVYTVCETSIEDVTERLEECVVAWLFENGTQKK